MAKRLENTLLKTAEHRTAPVEDPFVVLLPSKTPPRHEMHVQFMALRLAPPSVTGGSFLHLSESPCIRSSRPPSLDFGDRGAPPHEQQMPHHRHETTHWQRVAVAVLSPQLFPQFIPYGGHVHASDETRALHSPVRRAQNRTCAKEV